MRANRLPTAPVTYIMYLYVSIEYCNSGDLSFLSCSQCYDSYSFSKDESLKNNCA